MKRLDLKRGVRSTTDVAEMMRWETRDGRFAIQHSRSTLCTELPKFTTATVAGRTARVANPARIPDVWRVMLRQGEAWMILSTHKRRQGAEASLAAAHPDCLNDSHNQHQPEECDAMAKKNSLTEPQKQVYTAASEAGDAGHPVKLSQLKAVAAAKALAKKGLVTTTPGKDALIVRVVRQGAQISDFEPVVRKIYEALSEADRREPVADLIDSHFTSPAELQAAGASDDLINELAKLTGDELAKLVAGLLGLSLAAPAAKPGKSKGKKPQDAPAKAPSGPASGPKAPKASGKPADAPAAPEDDLPTIPGGLESGGELYDIWHLDDGRVFALQSGGKREFPWMAAAQRVGRLRANDRIDARNRGAKAKDAAAVTPPAAEAPAEAPAKAKRAPRSKAAAK